ncbi:MAG TPA: rod shape-determining protein RodA [Candidatus Eisenbacteria bacterium]|nr:rod shape-determining protein RodA [Candidatus Eisenbacteria bacterium]
MRLYVDRRLITHFEWLLPLFAIAVCGLGIATVYSATHAPSMDGPSPLAVRQAMWFAGGFAGMLLVLSFDYRRLDRYAYVVYGAAVVALILVPLIGRAAGGSRRWIALGPVSIQPSEFMKPALVIVLAHYFARTAAVRLTLREMILPALLTIPPVILILVQPDLGSAAMLGFVLISMLVLGGIRLRWFALLALPVIVASPILGPALWNHLKTYQQQRILTFINPELDPQGAGYHIIQSKIAVGSGMVWGRGFLRGTQNHLNFLPEQHTDFIFSVFSEEFGFVGAVALMALYLGLLLRGLVIALRARDRFGVLLVLGVMAIVFWQVVVNVGMTTGLLPVVGIPLPFFSYGGSSLFGMLVGIGLVMNVSMRRHLF